MSVLADGFEIEDTDLGDSLGSGSYKKAHVYLPAPDYVIVKCHDALDYDVTSEKMYEDERRTVRRALEMGVSCARIEASGVVKREGRLYASNLMRRYAASNRSCRADVLAACLNEVSIATTLRILNRLDDLAIGLWDLQFLVADDGTVVVNDVGTVVDPNDYHFEENRRTCRHMIAMARYAIHCRETGRVVSAHDCTYDLEDAGRNWVRREGSSQRALLEKFPVLAILSR